MTFRFNDELLLSDADRSLAEQAYPNVFFALDNPELRAEFKRVDEIALKAKTRSRWIGCAALIFATFSLLTFPLEPVIQGIWKSTIEYEIIFQYVAVFGATFGILALVFGNIGLGFGKVKRNWLQQRLITERLRQWNAQYFIAHAVDIAAAAQDQDAKSAWLAQRSVAFNRFKRMFIDQVESEYAKFTVSTAASFSGQSVTDPRTRHAFWIDEAWAKAAAKKPDKAHQETLNEVYKAYEETRLVGQIQYTNYVLSSDGPFWSSPAKQLHVLGNLSYVLVVLAFFSNFAALISALWIQFPIDWEVVSSLAIAFAIFAVGVRAMLEGLRPQRETRRMQLYAAAINLADTSFKAARSHAKYIEAMSMLERASYDEMIEFISSNEQARFVL